MVITQSAGLIWLRIKSTNISHPQKLINLTLKSQPPPLIKKVKMSKDIMTIEILKKAKGSEKLTEKQLYKLLDLINRLPESVRAKKAEELITLL
jgi:hypothetical protein